MSEPDVSNYEAIVGKRWDYYRPRFEKFERGGWLSWNWVALFATLAWLRYRRLHAWSWAYFFVSTPFLLTLVILAAAGGDSCELALSPAQPERLALVVVPAVVLGWILPPLFANRLYFNHVRALAAKGQPGKGTGGIAGALALQALVLGGTAVLAPSYANYTYRAMVVEGISLASAAKAPVTDFLMEHKRLPARLEDVVSTTSGRYVERVVLEPDGSIRATFGEKGKKLAGRGVVVTPVRKDDRIVEWTCRGVNLPARCLPAACR